MRQRIGVICLVTIALGGPARAADRVAPFAHIGDTPPTGPDFTPHGVPDIDPSAQRPDLTTAPQSLFDAAAAADPFALPPTCPCPLKRAIDAWLRAPDGATWFSVEWLIGTTRGASLVPVITTGPASSGVLAGSLGQPTTYPLFGGKQVLNNWRSGLRVELGYWFDPDHGSGVSARFYSLFWEREQFTAMANGTNVVNVPHFVPVGSSATQIPVFVGFPGVATGSATAAARTLFAGGDLNYRSLIDRTECSRLELLAGYRQMYLVDQLGANFTATPTGLGLAPIRRLVGGDNLHTRNDFFGPQLGLCASTGWERVTLEGHAATALGVTVSDLDFIRDRALHGAAAGVPALAGLPGANQIPLGSVMANGTLTYFGVVAEGGMRLNWSATDHVRLVSGYSFIYWNDVRRAPEMFTGSSVLRTRTVDSVTHLLSAGLEVRY
jgi:hypothetical protein